MFAIITLATFNILAILYAAGIGYKKGFLAGVQAMLDHDSKNNR